MNKGVHQASQKVIEPLHSLVIRSVIFNLLITLLITSVRDMLNPFPPFPALARSPPPCEVRR